MSPTHTVRPALAEDADAFAACHLACWREAYEELWGPERFDEFDLQRMATRRRKEIESAVSKIAGIPLEKVGQAGGERSASNEGKDSPPS